MATYRQYCPVARASEILAERWNLLLVRNLMFGATTFSDLARGVPAMSRSMLVKRLRELEAAGVIVSSPKASGPGSEYALTDAGRALGPVVDALGRWAEEWVEVLPEHADPGFALWAWCRVQLDRAALPSGRIVVHFDFYEERPGNRFFWLLVDDGAAEVCLSDPGGDTDLSVIARSEPFVDWHRGALDWQTVRRNGDVTVTGTRALVRAFPTWNTRVPVLPAV